MRKFFRRFKEHLKEIKKSDFLLDENKSTTIFNSDCQISVINKFSNLYAYKDIRAKLNTNSVNLDEFKDKKIVHISSWGISCGIADFCKVIKDEFDNLGVKQNDVIGLNAKLLSKGTFDENLKYVEKIVNQISSYDTIIIQHEFGLFVSDRYSWEEGIKLFYEFLSKIVYKYPQKDILVYFHTSPNAMGNYEDFYWKKIARIFFLIGNLPNLKFMVNTPLMVEEFAKYGILAGLGIDPVKNYLKKYSQIKDKLKHEVSSKLDIKQNDCIIAMVGFVVDYKGHIEIVEILRNLPENYKFLIIGGSNSPAGDKCLANLKEAILRYNLTDRVLITGCFDYDDLATYFDLSNIMVAPYSSSFKFGSSSIPLLMQAAKPIIAYDTQSISLLNNQCDFRPLRIVEYGNRERLKEQIVEVFNNKETQEFLKSQIIGYQKEMTIDKLIKLIVKKLSNKEGKYNADI